MASDFSIGDDGRGGSSGALQSETIAAAGLAALIRRVISGTRRPLHGERMERPPVVGRGGGAWFDRGDVETSRVVVNDPLVR